MRFSAVLALKIHPLSGRFRAFSVAFEARQIRDAWERSMSLSVVRSMDTQTKREIWLLALGTIIIEAPVAFAVFAVFSH
jgi:hypothetical protein